MSACVWRTYIISDIYRMEENDLQKSAGRITGCAANDIVRGNIDRLVREKEEETNHGACEGEGGRNEPRGEWAGS